MEWRWASFASSEMAQVAKMVTDFLNRNHDHIRQFHLSWPTENLAVVHYLALRKL